MNNEKSIFDEQVNIRVKEELKKKEYEKKLDTLIETTKIYPDIIKSLSGMRKSIEDLTISIAEVGSTQKEHLKNSKERDDELHNLFEKSREILKSIKDLEDNLINKNNPTSFIEIIEKMFNKQNKSMTDKNNSNSLISLMQKNSNLQSWITWGLITIVTIIGILDRIFIGH